MALAARLVSRYRQESGHFIYDADQLRLRENPGGSPVFHGGRLHSSIFFPTIDLLDKGLVNRLGIFKIFSETNNATSP